MLTNLTTSTNACLNNFDYNTHYFDNNMRTSFDAYSLLDQKLPFDHNRVRSNIPQVCKEKKTKDWGSFKIPLSLRRKKETE